MSLTAKLIWYVESRLGQPLSLSQVARAHGVSAFHVTRLFALATGRPLMAYVRARRLSEAAKALTIDSDILTAAIGAGYGSHEAFTRAFRAEFGLTPRACLHDPDTIQPLLTEALPMSALTSDDTLPPQTPRIERLDALTVAGLSGTYDFSNFSGIPGQWARFRDYFGHIDGQVGGLSYGVSYNYRPEGIDYLSGVEVSDTDNLPPEFTSVPLPAGRYAVFEHSGHVSGISKTWRTIYDAWLPASGLKVRYDPSFERMDDRFDGRTGTGVIEIWVPVD
ncbi:AraC family transcriptional regulator [Asticcacaulis sp. YBE204]|uniref:AraC family transcriptional regulator n=1 Tax=Asticcacaulis sp. YBE204 TaxID=1282363 RepID=UPI0003C3D60E|nr:AraC family transcriptional regulator [Asticcacaulis sp. YBE204]ESQ78587.1 hypothetical protein AEYBE204_13635 [Asticcacaulis sp. YBE204]